MIEPKHQEWNLRLCVIVQYFMVKPMHCRGQRICSPARPSVLFYYGLKGSDSKLGNGKMLYCGVWIDGELNGQAPGAGLERRHWCIGESLPSNQKAKVIKSQNFRKVFIHNHSSKRGPNTYSTRKATATQTTASSKNKNTVIQKYPFTMLKKTHKLIPFRTYQSRKC